MRSTRPPLVRLALAGLGTAAPRLGGVVGRRARVGATRSIAARRGDRGAGRGAVRRTSVARAPGAAGPCGGTLAPRIGADHDRHRRDGNGGHDERGGREPALRRAARRAGPGDPAGDGGAHDERVDGWRLGADGEPGSTRCLAGERPFHMLRLTILARRHGLEPYASPTPTSPIAASPTERWKYALSESVKAPLAFILERNDR